MKQTINVGVVCLVRKTFDWQAALELYREIRQDLTGVENVNWEFIQQPLVEAEDARRAASHLAGMDLDGLVCISGTFHLGHLVLELARAVSRPLLLWGLPELPYDGGKIRLNSVCGVNLDASNLYKGGYNTYHVNIGKKIDEDWLDSLRINRALAKTRLGLVGGPAHGFFNLGADLLNLWQQMGVLVDQYQLSEIFEQPVAPGEVQEFRSQLQAAFAVDDISEEQLSQTALLCAKLAAFNDSRGLSALAIRCWPEFARDFGIAPCAAISLLQSQGRIIACEGDVEGALSMIAQRAMGAATPFLADLSQVDLQQDFALLWHCGVAPCNLADGSCRCSLDSYHAGGQGVTADFVLSPGRLSLLRMDSVGREIRLFLGQGEAVAMDKELKGTYAKAVFPGGVQALLETLTGNGVAHHISVVYGDYIRPLELLAKAKGWRVLK